MLLKKNKSVEFSCIIISGYHDPYFNLSTDTWHLDP